MDWLLQGKVWPRRTSHVALAAIVHSIEAASPKVEPLPVAVRVPPHAHRASRNRLTRPLPAGAASSVKIPSSFVLRSYFHPIFLDRPTHRQRHRAPR